MVTSLNSVVTAMHGRLTTGCHNTNTMIQRRYALFSTALVGFDSAGHDPHVRC